MDRETAEMYRNNVAQAAAIYESKALQGGVSETVMTLTEWTYPEEVRDMALKVITQGLRSLLRPDISDG